MSILVDKVTKIYGQQHALDEVSIQIGPGEIVGLLGPNGAGKSTLMKIITCFIPPTHGDVRVFGRSIFEDPLEVRRRLGYLPESNPLYTEMYVREYLLFVAGIHNIPNPQKRVSEMIELTGLDVEQKKKIGALSKGYRQRVGLAQAMIHDPDVLILDEPTSGLDPNQLVEIRQIIRDLGKNKTVVLSTHIMQEVEAVCNRVIIINHGKIVADDQTRNLSVLAANEVVLEVEFSGPASQDELQRIKGVRKLVSADQYRWMIHTTSDREVRELIFNFAVSRGLKVLSLKQLERRLEDVFQQLTKGDETLI